jgi:hypothetical protein
VAIFASTPFLWNVREPFFLFSASACLALRSSTEVCKSAKSSVMRSTGFVRYNTAAREEV